MGGKLAWAGVAALWVAFFVLAYGASQYGNVGGLDFQNYHEGATRLREGVNPYQLDDGSLTYYQYPPLFGLLLAPLTFLPWRDALTVFFLLNAALLVITLWALATRFPARQRLMVWAAPLAFLPLFEAFHIGQVTIILLALFTFAWLAAIDDRPFLAGALLALAAWLKLFPVLVIAYFVWKRDWVVVRGALIVGVALGVVQIALAGLDTLLAMFTPLLSLSSSGEDFMASANMSLLGFVSQVFGSYTSVRALVDSPALLIISRVALTALIVGVSAWAIGGAAEPARGSSGGRRFDLEYALAVLVAHMLSPTLFGAGMPPLILVLALMLRGTRARGLRWLVMLIGLGLSLQLMYILGYRPDPPQTVLTLGIGFVVLLALWASLVALLVRAAPQPVTAYAAR